MNEEIIPAIDLMDGKCVRLEKGNFNRRTVYFDDPVEYIKKLIDHGIRRVHVVDLDGARTGAVVHYRLLEKICSSADIEVDFGGGINKENDLKAVLGSGATYVSLSSVAVKSEDDLDSWIAGFGPKTFILCPDVSGGFVHISGWVENSGIRINEFIGNYLKKGINKFLCTDINRDGMMAGPSFNLYKNILKEFNEIYLIASGGVATVADIEALFDLGAGGVVVGKAIFEGAVSLTEISEIGGRF